MIPTSTPQASDPKPSPWQDQGIRALGATSFLFALLQSLCTAVLTVSGIRVAIGLTALAAASGVFAPPKGWHQDAVRIPMLWIATAGAVVNLTLIGWIRYLRGRASAQWRRQTLSAQQKRSERLQIALAIATLLLVAIEVRAHTIMHPARLPTVSHAVNR